MRLQVLESWRLLDIKATGGLDLVPLGGEVHLEEERHQEDGLELLPLAGGVHLEEGPHNDGVDLVPLAWGLVLYGEEEDQLAGVILDDIHHGGDLGLRWP